MDQFCSPLHCDFTPSLQWIEVSSSFQIPSFQIIGLPSPEICESKERVRSAIEANGLEFPKRRVLVNLSPAQIRKTGTGVDLAISLAILAYHQPSHAERASQKILAWGELALNGELRPSGKLHRTVTAAFLYGIDLVILAKEDEVAALTIAARYLAQTRNPDGQSTQIRVPKIFGVTNLREAWETINSSANSANMPSAIQSKAITPIRDSSDLLPLEPAIQRIIEVASAGQHHLLLVGPKGTGKTHALKWLQFLRAAPEENTFFERIWIDELRTDYPAFNEDSPSHWLSPEINCSSLVGSILKNELRPGLLAASHGGQIVADELPEWPRDARECLRRPLESASLTLSRARTTLQMKVQVQLIATANLCPCGGWPEHIPIPRKQRGGATRCICKPHLRQSYWARLSGPILDRIDLVVPVQGFSTSPTAPIHPTRVLEKVESIRRKLGQTWGKPPAHLTAIECEAILKRHPTFECVLERNTTLSLRGRHKVLRTALTLAGIEGKVLPTEANLFEAGLYRAEALGLTT